MFLFGCHTLLVPSKANISDLPSRNDFDLLNSPEYKAEAFELVWPPLS